MKRYYPSPYELEEYLDFQKAIKKETQESKATYYSVYSCNELIGMFRVFAVLTCFYLQQPYLSHVRQIDHEELLVLIEQKNSEFRFLPSNSFVLYHHEIVIGFCLLTEFRSYPFVYDFGILKRFQGQGLRRKLLEHTITSLYESSLFHERILFVSR